MFLLLSVSQPEALAALVDSLCAFMGGAGEEEQRRRQAETLQDCLKGIDEREEEVSSQRTRGTR